MLMYCVPDTLRKQALRLGRDDRLYQSLLTASQIWRIELVYCPLCCSFRGDLSLHCTRAVGNGIDAGGRTEERWRVGVLAYWLAHWEASVWWLGSPKRVITRPVKSHLWREPYALAGREGRAAPD